MVVMVVQFCEHSPNDWIVHFKQMDFKVCELYVHQSINSYFTGQKEQREQSNLVTGKASSQTFWATVVLFFFNWKPDLRGRTLRFEKGFVWDQRSCIVYLSGVEEKVEGYFYDIWRLDYVSVNACRSIFDFAFGAGETIERLSGSYEYSVFKKL